MLKKGKRGGCRTAQRSRAGGGSRLSPTLHTKKHKHPPLHSVFSVRARVPPTKGSGTEVESVLVFLFAINGPTVLWKFGRLNRDGNSLVRGSHLDRYRR